MIPIILLPLRKRKEAIPHLVNNFLERFSKRYKKPIVSVSPDAMEYLMSFNWPGNIRQLKNIIERMFLMAQKSIINVNDLEDIIDIVSFDTGENHGQETHNPTASSFDFAAHGPMEPLRKARQRLEKIVIMRALEMASGQRAVAAELLEIKPRTLRQKMSDYGIEFRRTGKRDHAKL